MPKTEFIIREFTHNNVVYSKMCKLFVSDYEVDMTVKMGEIDLYVPSNTITTDEQGHNAIVMPLLQPYTHAKHAYILPTLEIEIIRMHNAGYLHLDIHEGNMLVSPQGRIVLIDFESCIKMGDPRLIQTELFVCVPGNVKEMEIYVPDGKGGKIKVTTRDNEEQRVYFNRQLLEYTQSINTRDEGNGIYSTPTNRATDWRAFDRVVERCKIDKALTEVSLSDTSVNHDHTSIVRTSP